MGTGTGGCDLRCQWIIACGCAAAAYFSGLALMTFRLERDNKRISAPAMQKFNALIDEAREYVTEQSEIIGKLQHRHIPVHLDSLNDIAFYVNMFSQIEGFINDEADRMIWLAQKLEATGRAAEKVLLVDLGMDPNIDPFALPAVA